MTDEFIKMINEIEKGRVQYLDIPIKDWEKLRDAHYREIHKKEETQTDDNVITVDIPEKELLSLCLMAHEKNITLNQLVNDILRDTIKQKQPIDQTEFLNECYKIFSFGLIQIESSLRHNNIKGAKEKIAKMWEEVATAERLYTD